MYFKVLLLVVFASCQIILAQQPPTLPNPLGTGITPPFLGGFNGLNGLGAFGGLNGNWARPYYTAAAEGWRRYFEQLQQARNQLYQTLTNAGNSAQNATSAARDVVNSILSAIPRQTKHANDDDETQILGDLKPPAIETPVQHDVQETQIVTTVTRPQVHDVQQTRPQGQVSVTHLTQGQTTSRQPQNVGMQTVTSAARPITSTVPQVIPQVGGQIIPQLGSQPINWVGK